MTTEVAAVAAGGLGAAQLQQKSAESALWFKIWIARIVVLVIFGAAWEYVARNKIINPLFIGIPSEILQFLWEGLFVNYALIKDALWTIAGTAMAFLLGSGAGILMGLLFVVYPSFEKFIDPLMTALNALPRIALAPLFLLWFGLGLSSKVALGASLTFFIVLSSTVAGARSVDLDLLTLARTLGAKPSQVFMKITLPSAVPTLFSGLRLGLIYAMLGVIASEIIAAEHGLGQSVSYLSGTMQINGVYAILLLLAILGTSITWIMSTLESKLLRWR